jgi:hypothetical protein
LVQLAKNIEPKSPSKFKNPLLGKYRQRSEEEYSISSDESKKVKNAGKCDVSKITIEMKSFDM